MADDMVTLDWSNEEELLKEEAEEEKKAEAAKKDEVVKTEKDTGDDKEKKDGDTEAMDTCTTEVKEEEKKEEEWEKTLLTTVLRGPIKITNVQIRDLLSRELQHVLHKSVNTQIDFSNKKGIIHLNFLPLKDRVAVDILKKLAKFQFSNKDVKIQCSRAVAALLGFELRRQGIGPAPQGTLQFDKVLFLYGIPSETTEEVLRAMFECPICIIPLDEEGKNMGAAFLEFRSKKASKQCYNDNQDVEIGDVKVTLHNKYQFAGRKEEEDEEKEERDKKKKEQEKKAKEGQQRRNPNQNRGRGAGKSFNRSHAVKQKFNQARQMGAFSAGGGMGRMGFGDGMGMGGGRRMGGAGVSPNLMMNQMMAMMRMSQGMGDGGMGDGMGGMGEGMGMGGRRMGGGGMGQGMGSGMGRMGRQGGMGGGGMGGFDDLSGGDYGFDDYESGYNQGRNSAGRRQPQSLMGGQRRGSFGSAPNEQKDSVVDLFESALDAVDNQIGGRGNPNRQTSLSGGRKSEPFGGNLQSGVQNRQKLQGKSNNAKTGRDFSWERQGGNQSVGGASNTMGTRFGSPGKNKQPMSLLEFSDFNVSGGNKTGYGESSSSRFGQDSNDRFLGGENDRFKQKEEYSDYSYFQDDSYDKSRSYNEGFNVSNVGQDRNTSFSASRSIELYGSGNEDIYRHNADSGQSNRQNRLSVDSIQPVSYPEIYSSKGSSGMAEIYGSSALASKPTKRTFTEQPLKRTYDDYLVSSTERAQDDFVFKKPMLTSFKGVQQQGIIASKQQGNRGGQQQGNRGGHQQGNRGQQQGNRGGHQQGNKGGQQQGNRGGQQKGNRGGQQGNRGQKRGQGRRNKKSGRQNNSGFSY